MCSVVRIDVCRSIWAPPGETTDRYIVFVLEEYMSEDMRMSLGDPDESDGGKDIDYYTTQTVVMFTDDPQEHGYDDENDILWICNLYCVDYEQVAHTVEICRAYDPEVFGIQL